MTATQQAKRVNRYSGKCSKCGEWVEAEAGLLTGRPGAWSVEHDGECPEPVAPPAIVVDGSSQAAADPAVEGMHRTADGTIYKVQRSRESGNLYAKRLVVLQEAIRDEAGEILRDADGKLIGAAVVDFLYEPGSIRKLSADTLLSTEDAKAFGVLYGTCCVCGARLSDETSIKLGIGPVCGGRMTEWLTGVKLTVAQWRYYDEIRGGRSEFHGREWTTVEKLAVAGLVVIERATADGSGSVVRVAA